MTGAWASAWAPFLRADLRGLKFFPKGKHRGHMEEIDVTKPGTDWRRILEVIREEFRNFSPPSGYRGGRHQTALKYVFAHVRSDGSLGRIEVDKPGGSRFYLGIENP